MFHEGPADAFQRKTQNRQSEKITNGTANYQVSGTTNDLVRNHSVRDETTVEMNHPSEPQKFGADGIAAPLRFPAFRNIWLASLLSNLGILIQGVGAAWTMTQMTSSADKVALVQTALMLPVMFISMPAGAIADMYDRRIVVLVSIDITLAAATALTTLACLGMVTPNLLLALCFAVGSGMASLGPTWQSSVSEQVSPEALPAAVALNGVSYNIARSLGPAIGGTVVASWRGGCFRAECDALFAAHSCVAFVEARH